MKQNILKLDGFFNKLLFWCVLICIGIALSGCGQREHLRPDLGDSAPSDARYAYECDKKFPRCLY